MIDASREFICVRPQTYEDKHEAAFLLTLFAGRAGNLENTVFCILAPDGKQQLTIPSRSPKQQFSGAPALADFMATCFKSYAAKAKPITSLPLHNELALALNVAACDLAPLVILNAKTERELKQLKTQVAKLAWETGNIGRQHYFASVGDKLTKDVIEGLTIQPGITIVEAGPYAQSTQLLGFAAPKAKDKQIAQLFMDARAKHAPADKQRRDHVRQAKRGDIAWESELPVTDSKVNRQKPPR